MHIIDVERSTVRRRNRAASAGTKKFERINDFDTAPRRHVFQQFTDWCVCRTSRPSGPTDNIGIYWPNEMLTARDFGRRRDDSSTITARQSFRLNALPNCSEGQTLLKKNGTFSYQDPPVVARIRSRGSVSVTNTTENSGRTWPTRVKLLQWVSSG